MLIVRGGGVVDVTGGTLAVLDALDADDAAGGGDAAHEAMRRIGAAGGWGMTVAAWAEVIARLEPPDPDGGRRVLFGDGADGVDPISRDTARGLVEAADRGEEFALIAAREAVRALPDHVLWATSWALAWEVQRATDRIGGLRRFLAVLACHLVAVHGADASVEAVAERAALVVATATPTTGQATRARLEAIAGIPDGPIRTVAIWAQVAAVVGVPAPIVVLDAAGVPEAVATATHAADLELFATAATAAADAAGAHDTTTLREAVDRVCALPDDRLLDLLTTIAVMIALRVPTEERARAALARITRGPRDG